MQATKDLRYCITYISFPWMKSCSTCSLWPFALHHSVTHNGHRCLKASCLWLLNMLTVPGQWVELDVLGSEMMDTFLEGDLYFHYLWGRAVFGDQAPSHSVLGIPRRYFKDGCQLFNPNPTASMEHNWFILRYTPYNLVLVNTNSKSVQGAM